MPSHSAQWLRCVLGMMYGSCKIPPIEEEVEVYSVNCGGQKVF